jgi:hypothetical protein
MPSAKDSLQHPSGESSETCESVCAWRSLINDGR